MIDKELINKNYNSFKTALPKLMKKYQNKIAVVKAQVQDKGARFENLIACALLKNNHFKEDCYGETRKLYYLRNKDKKEIDFLLTKNNKPFQMIEAKWKDDKLSPHFDLFSKDIPVPVETIQVVRELDREKTTPSGHKIRKASRWLLSIK